MIFETDRTKAVLLNEEHSDSIREYYVLNREHLAPWEPKRPENYHSKETWIQRVKDFTIEQERMVSFRILAVQPNSNEIVGVCYFTNIVHGVFRACNVGYSISKQYGGQGLMTEIVGGSIDYVFKELDLHRIMANYVPENVRSARVLKKLGFEEEGYAKSYLFIAGKWRDHILTAKLNPNHPQE